MPFNIVIIRNSESLPCDTSGARLWRSGLYAKYLKSQGHNVTWYTSSFDHYNGKQRKVVGDFKDGTDLHTSVKLINTVGYSDNVSVRRFIDHFIFSIKLFFRLVTADKPDLIQCSYPTPDSCFAAVIYGKLYNVPVVVDIRDQWPDVMFETKTGVTRTIARIILSPYSFMKKVSMHGCKAIMAANQDFLDWGLKVANRPQAKSDFVNFIPFEEPVLGEQHDAEASEILSNVDYTEDEFLLTFAGTIGQMFDFSYLYECLDNNLITTSKFKIVLCGRGSELDNLKNQFSKFSNVHFTGQLDSRTVFALLKRSDALFAPYKKMSNFENHLPNKFMEYCAAGKPIISSLSGFAKQLLTQHDFGTTYANSKELGDALTFYQTKVEVTKRQSQNAKNMYETTFHPSILLKEMETHLTGIVENSKIK